METLGEIGVVEGREQRRLAAIMFTDMVGYTRLTGTSEERAMKLLDEQRKVIRAQLAKHDGREVKTIGDAFLVEFTSSLDAVRCAVGIQESMHEVNVHREPEEQSLLRIGLHLGEVLERNGDVYGDAVNVASRIEPLALAGGICVTKQVYENVANKSGYGFESLGRRELKNVPVPLEVYRIVMSWEEKRSRARQGLPPDRVAVLPFVNISPDPGDEYFADGLTEELISKLSQVSGLKVIARTSVMNYKKKQMNASEIGSELGVGTLVEGSVRKAGSKIRVSVQVIDSNTEEHRWSTNYDRNLDDIFAVQSEIASKVTDSLPISLLHRKSAPQSEDTENVEAYTAFLQAKQLLHESTEVPLNSAVELFKQAVDLDPNFARAWVGLAHSYAGLAMHGFKSRSEAQKLYFEALDRAFSINPDLPEAHAERGLFAWFDDDFVTAVSEAKKAIELNPNLAEAYENLALIRSSMGGLKESVALLEKARELDPLSPMIHFLGEVYMYTGREAEALKLWEKMEKFNPIDTYSRLWEYEVTKKRLDRAWDMQNKLERLGPGLVGVVGTRGQLEAMAGNREKALEVIKKLEESYGKAGVMPNYVAYIYYWLGDMDNVFVWLNRAVDAHSLIPQGIRFSPLFEDLRKDPRYRELLIKNGLPPDNEN